MKNKTNGEVIKRVEILNTPEFIYAVAKINMVDLVGSLQFIKDNVYMVHVTMDDNIQYHIMGSELDDIEVVSEAFRKRDNFHNYFSVKMYQRDKALKELGI